MLDKFIQQAERDYEDGVAAELARRRESFKQQSDLALSTMRVILRSNLNEDVYRALNLTFDYLEDGVSGIPVASFLDGDQEYRLELREWDQETYPPLHIWPYGSGVPFLADILVGSQLHYHDGNLTTNLLLFVKACRSRLAARAAYQKQQADNLAEIERQATERKAESDRKAESFRARQVEGNAVKERVIAEARTFMASSKALFAPVTIYKWTWAISPTIDFDGNVVEDGRRDEGWSTQYQGDDYGWITLWQDGRARVLSLTAYNLPVVERFTFDNWADCPDELTEYVYAAMPDGWHRGYDHGYGWQQKDGEIERINIGRQPCAWLRAVAYGEPGQRCTCGEDGSIYVDGLWRCYNCWRWPRADVGSDDLPF